MIQQFSRFINNGAGLEKTLRLTQCVSQVIAALTVSSALAVQLTTVKLQLALSKPFCTRKRPYVLTLLSSTEILPLLRFYRLIPTRVCSAGHRRAKLGGWAD